MTTQEALDDARSTLRGAAMMFAMVTDAWQRAGDGEPAYEAKRERDKAEQALCDAAVEYSNTFLTATSAR